MSLVKGCKWAKEEFEHGSRPTNSTIIRWIETGEIPGKIIAGLPYVDADRFALSGAHPAAQKKRVTGLHLIT